MMRWPGATPAARWLASTPTLRGVGDPSSFVSFWTLSTTPRGPRLDAHGALHHVVVRGLDRQAVFEDETDRADFVARLAALAGGGRRPTVGATAGGREGKRRRMQPPLPLHAVREFTGHRATLEGGERRIVYRTGMELVSYPSRPRLQLPNLFLELLDFATEILDLARATVSRHAAANRHPTHHPGTPEGHHDHE